MAFVLDQSYTTESSGEYFSLRLASNNNVKLGQSFQPSVTDTCTRISLLLKKNGSPTGNITVTIEADTAGSPSGTPLATSSNVDVSSVGSDVYVNFDFGSPASLTATTTYWMVLQGDFSFSGTDMVQWKVNSAQGYTNGTFKVNDGTNWGSQSFDANFQEYRNTLQQSIDDSYFYFM